MLICDQTKAQMFGAREIYFTPSNFPILSTPRFFQHPHSKSSETQQYIYLISNFKKASGKNDDLNMHALSRHDAETINDVGFFYEGR